MPPFGWEFPYPSQRMPVLARNMVATSQPLAAQAGLHMLRQGGNAADAAIAAAAVLTVIEPTSNGLGSDAFCIVWAGGGLHGLNASGRSPRALTAERFAGKKSVPELGWDGVTVPGAVSAWVEVAGKFGAMPFPKLLEPAIEYARRGFLVAPQTAAGWALSAKRYASFESWQKTFCPNGRAPGPGERFTAPDHAESLLRIAQTRGEDFYRGELGRKIAAHARKTGGLITEEDLAAHKAEWVRPLAIDYRAMTLHELPPNGQGITALIMLGILRHRDVAAHTPDSAAALHLQIEAMKLAFADARRYIADPAFMDVSTDDLLNPEYLARRAELIDPTRAQDPGHGAPMPGGTIYLCAADADGNMVSYIQSNYTGFGSGIVVPGTGISLQNRGCCFTLEAGHPNQVGPGKRPYQTIIPGFLTAVDKPLAAFGVMGGFMQPQGHAQVVIRVADYEQNPQAALDAPRWRVDNGLEVNIEPGFEPAVYEELRALGHLVTVAPARTVAHGGGQMAWRLENGYLGASDPRRDGQAAGF